MYIRPVWILSYSHTQINNINPVPKCFEYLKYKTIIIQTMFTLLGGLPPDGTPIKTITGVLLPTRVYMYILIITEAVIVIVCLLFNIVFRKRKLGSVSNHLLYHLHVLHFPCASLLIHQGGQTDQSEPQQWHHSWISNSIECSYNIYLSNNHVWISANSMQSKTRNLLLCLCINFWLRWINRWSWHCSVLDMTWYFLLCCSKLGGLCTFSESLPPTKRFVPAVLLQISMCSMIVAIG